MFTKPEIDKLKNVNRELLSRLTKRNDNWKGVLFFGPLIDTLCVKYPSKPMAVFAYVPNVNQFNSILSQHHEDSTLSFPTVRGSLSELVAKDYHPWLPKNELELHYELGTAFSPFSSVDNVHVLRSLYINETWSLNEVNTYLGEDPPIFVFNGKVYVNRENLDTAKQYYGNSV